MTTARPNLSMIHGMDCLQAVAAAGGRPVGTRELARQLRLEHTRVHRAVGTLCLLGLLEQTPDRKYRPGPALHVLAAQSLKGSRLLQAALPLLAVFREEKFTVALGVLWQEQVCYLIHARPPQKLEAGIGTHDLHPATRSSLGLVLLAASSAPASVERTAEELAAVERTRRTGVGRILFPNGELSLAVPVGTPAFAAIGVSRQGLAAADEAGVIARLRAAAAAIDRETHDER